jgi:hypothetical protein
LKFASMSTFARTIAALGLTAGAAVATSPAHAADPTYDNCTITRNAFSAAALCNPNAPGTQFQVAVRCEFAAGATYIARGPWKPQTWATGINAQSFVSCDASHAVEAWRNVQ